MSRITLDIETAKFTKGLNKASQKFKQNTKKMEAAAGRLKSGLFAATAQFAAVGLALKAVVGSAADIETVTTQFEVLTGSVETAKDSIQELLEFSASTPFQFEGIAKAGQILLAFGVGSEDLRMTMGRIGDVAAASGQDLKELAKIFGQIKGEGKLMGERLAQLQERGVVIGPAIRQAFKDLGREGETTGKSIKELGAKGLITFDIFEQAFNSLSDEGGPAFEGMIKQSRTLTGLISTLKDNWGILLINIGQKFLPTFKEVAKVITAFLQRLHTDDSFTLMIGRVLKVATVLLGLKLAMIAGGAAALGLTAKVLTLGTALVAASVKTYAMLAAMSLAPIKAFGIAMILAVQSVSTMRIAVIGLMAGTGLGLIILALPAITRAFEVFWKDAFTATKVGVDAIVGMVRGMGHILKSVFSLFTGGGIDEIKLGWKKIQEAWVGGAKGFQDIMAEKEGEGGKQQAKILTAKEKQILKIMETESAIRTLQGKKLSDEERASAIANYGKMSDAKVTAILKSKTNEKIMLESESGLLAKFEGELYKERASAIRELVHEEWLLKKEQGEELNAQDVLDIKDSLKAVSDQELIALAEKAQAAREGRNLEHEEKLIQMEEFEASINEIEEDSRSAWLEKYRGFTDQQKLIKDELVNFNKDKDKSMLKGTKLFLNSMVTLQEQGNKHLAAIGKGAAEVQRGIALTDMGIAIYRAAAGVFSALNLAFPFLAPVIGGIAAAAVVGGGLRHMDEVRRAEHGGIVERLPGTPGRGDFQPFLLEPGEMITPGSDVSTVREASEEILRQRDDEEDEEKNVGVVIGIEEDASSMIFAKRIENEAMGVGVR